MALRPFAPSEAGKALAGAPPSIVWPMIVYPLATLVCAVLCLFLVNLLPGSPTLWNVLASASTENYPTSQIGLGQVDDFTECIAVTIGLGENAERMTPLKRAVASPTLGNCQDLQKYARGDHKSQSEYWRYWNGYQIFSRPILLFGDVRLLHAASFTMLAAAFGWFLYSISKFGLSRAVAVAAAVVCVPAPEQLGNLPHSVVLILAFCAAAFAVTRKRPTRTGWKAEFIVLGMLCSFLDLSTIPVVSLSLPLLALYWKGDADPASPRLTASDIVILSILWAGGWLVCWMCKWLVAAIGGEPAVLATLQNIIAHRLGGGVGPLGDDGRPLAVTPIVSLTHNLSFCVWGLILVMALVTSRARSIAAAIVRGKRRALADYLPPLMIFLLPIVWLCAVEQHSIWHASFVSRVYLTNFAMVIAWLLRLPKSTLDREEPAEASRSRPFTGVWRWRSRTS